MRVLERKLTIIAIGVADLQEQLSLPFSLHWGKHQNPQEYVLCFHPCRLSVTVLPILQPTVHNYRYYSSFIIAMHICPILLQTGTTLRNCRHALYIRTQTQRVGVAMGVVCCEVIDYHTICPYYFAFQRCSIKPVFSVHPVLNTPQWLDYWALLQKIIQKMSITRPRLITMGLL